MNNDIQDGVNCFKRVHHIAIIVSDEKSVMFYQKLGFREYRRIIRESDIIVLMKGNGIELEVFVDPRHPQRSTVQEPLGLRHFALQVDSIENALEDLSMEAGSIERDWNGIRYCYVSDPDGLLIELHE